LAGYAAAARTCWTVPAPTPTVVHALGLGIVGLAVSITGAVVTWGRGPAFGPARYPLAVIAIAMPCA
jgi:hypothetical protein